MKTLFGRIVMHVREVVSGRRDAKEYGDPEAHRRGLHNRDAELARHYVPTPPPVPVNFPTGM
ncbi:hypothetical protein [Streptomyces olivaceoviridis]|uniref:hypothetical protein n=1 Tax=Streptomyces olivaceoviridis TaxID=1921 RepID=UPI0036AEFC30